VTTEIAILNQSAVALAADSAVTVSGGGRTGLKVYDGVNKLFELIKGRPVGVMIYNAADLSFRPWETIIKTYREERRTQALPTLDAYVQDFKQFLVEHDQLFSDRQQIEAYRHLLDSDLDVVRGYVLEAVAEAIDSGRKLTPVAVSRIVNRQAKDYWDYARSGYRLDAWDEELPSLRRLGAELKDLLDERIDAVLENLPLSDARRANLRVGLIHRSLGFAQNDSFSGVVIAGFGEDEYYPRLREFRTKGLYNGRLLARDNPDSACDIGVDRPGDVRSFAQGDMIRSFTDGIQDQVRREMNQHWRKWLDARTIGREVARHADLAHLDRADRRVITKVVNDHARVAVRDFFVHMAEYERANVRGPLLQSVAYLPKDEMGAMAESLVNLTTLKRRVSINEAQTVGGAVDVAVVSRGDGFVWLKRKHYFDQSINPSWAQTHAGERATPVTRGTER
jgi:hypothetical protein